MAQLDGDWHEFESKALRKENERKDKEARRQAQREAALKSDKDKKRPSDAEAGGPKAKRVHTDGTPADLNSKTDEDVEMVAAEA